MDAKVLYISESGKSALIAVEKKNGWITERVSGFVPLSGDEEVLVGQTKTLPWTKVRRVEQASDDGTVFNWLEGE